MVTRKARPGRSGRRGTGTGSPNPTAGRAIGQGPAHGSPVPQRPRRPARTASRPLRRRGFCRDRDAEVRGEAADAGAQESDATIPRNSRTVRAVRYRVRPTRTVVARRSLPGTTCRISDNKKRWRRAPDRCGAAGSVPRAGSWNGSSADGHSGGQGIRVSSCMADTEGFSVYPGWFRASRSWSSRAHSRNPHAARRTSYATAP